MSRWRFTGRGLAVAAVCAVVGAGAVQTTAHADTALPVPTALMTSPAPVGGTAGDACGGDQPYGYIGLNDITFEANATTTDGSFVAAEFAVTPSDGSASYDYTGSSLPSGSQSRLTLPRTDFGDGVTYTWQARGVSDAGAVSDWSAPCHFVSDHTPPAAPVLTSTDFPSIGSGLPAPVVRTTGTVHVAVSGPGSSDVVSVNYSLNLGTIPVGGGPSAPVGPDGTADITLTPINWGPNTLLVQTVDRAGNVSQPVSYEFLMASATTMDKHGDLNGDGTADLIATGTDGSLHTLLGKGDGTLRPAVSYPDSPANFTSGLIAQNGDENGDGYQDLLWINPGHEMEKVVNNGLGDLGRQSSGFYRPDGSDWSAATQLVIPGAADGTSWGGVMTVEKGHLLLWPTSMFGISGDPTDLGSGYARLTVLTPGDLTGDGVADLLIRNDATGQLRIAPRADDGTLLPKADWKAVGKGFTANEYPLLTVVGDANGDGFPDMYGVTARGGLDFVPGAAGGHFGKAVPVAGTGLNWSAVNGLA